MNRVAFFHTTLNTPAYMKARFAVKYPDVGLFNIVDDSVLGEVRENGCRHTSAIVRRLVAYGQIAQEQGAWVMMNMCTTLDEAVREAQKALEIPFLSVDGPMLRQAVRMGKRVALLVTADTTIGPSGRAAKLIAAEEGRDVEIDVIHVEGAFAAITVENDREKHDRLVVQAASNAAREHDVIVLAQVTMADVAPALASLPIPVLTSPESGLEQLRPYLEKDAGGNR